MGAIIMIYNLKLISRALLASASAFALNGCAATPYFDADVPSPQVDVTQATLPKSVQPYPRIDRVLRCISDTRVLRRRTFVVGSFADSTGKLNATAQGATGNFMPQGGSAAYITDALKKAGANVISAYFGTPQKQVKADYAINGIFNSLDFSTPVSADLRVSGIGPVAGAGWAQLTLSIQLDQARTRLNRQMSMIQRPVKYQQLGAGVGHDFSSVLVTGTIVVRNQERLQFEALNGPIALGVADVVMKEFPKATKKCRGMVADLLDTAT
jgi:hypothetical protein